jgi:hypothetical protein
MSTRKVMSRVSTSFNFAAQKINENLLSLIRSENMNITDDQMRKITDMVERSATQALSLSSDGIEKAVNNINS